MSPPSPPGFTLMPQLSSVLEDGSQNHTVTCGFPVAQLVEHGTSNAKIMGSIPRESKS